MPNAKTLAAQQKVRELELKRIPISLIKFDESNPNVMSKTQFASLKLAMEKYGYLAPVLLDGDFNIIDGEHRARLYQHLGKEEIPAYIVDVDKVDAKILRQLMNKLRGQHDREKDALEFKTIYEAGRLQDLAKHLADSQTRFQAILERKFQIRFNQTESIPPIPRTPTSQVGDIYQLAPHRLMCGDSTDLEEVKTLLAGSKPRMIFADPPFELENDEYLDPFLEGLKDVEVFVLNGDRNTTRLLLRYHRYFVNFFIAELGSIRVYGGPRVRIAHNIVTHYRKGKNNYQNLHDSFSTILRFTKFRDSRTHEKNLDLAKQFIEHYTREGEAVLDMFGGFGSTLIASQALRRVSYLMEKDPAHIDAILERYRRYAQEEPVKVENGQTDHRKLSHQGEPPHA